MSGFVKTVDENGVRLLKLSGNCTEKIRQALEFNDYDHIELAQVLDWSSYWPAIADSVEKVRSIRLFLQNNIDGLERLRNLHFLGLSPDAEQKPFVDLSRFVGLRGFSGHWSKKYSITLPRLREIVSLSLVGVPENACKAFGGFEHLRTLRLKRGSIETLSGLKESCIEELELIGLRKLEDISSIQCIKSLKMLWIEDAPKISDLSSVFDLKRLNALYLYNCGEIQNCFWLQGLDSIVKLWMPIPIGQLDWDIILSRPSLEKVALIPPILSRLSESELLPSR